MGLIYQNKVKSNRDAFIQKVIEISRKLNVHPNWLMFIMNAESGLNHKAVNPTGGATGLIQFMPDTAKGLGTTTTALKNMSNVNQLNYVYKYFNQYADKINKIKGVNDLYLITFYPYALDKPNKYVIGSEKSMSWASKIADQNPAINPERKDFITKADFNKYVKNKIKDAVEKDGYKFSEVYRTKSSKIIPVILIIAGLGITSYFLFINKNTKIT